jgi:DNA-binding XRE family transcriptional regulator
MRMRIPTSVGGPYSNASVKYNRAGSATFRPPPRELRKARGLTQEALAEAADLSGNYISDLELGLKVPSLTILVRLSQALQVATPDLLADFTRDAVKRMKVRRHRS